MIANRIERRESIPLVLDKPGLIGVELGVAAGYFSNILLGSERVPGEFAFDRLYSVDRWNDHHGLDECLTTLEILNEWGSRSVVLRATFDEALDLFKDEYFDFVYIDGYAHTGQDGGQTLEQWWPKVKSGGVFAGHDYHPQWEQTQVVVDQFVAGKSAELNLTTEELPEYPSWWIRKS